MAVRELELDLDAFEGPFDLLLTLLLREELEPADVDMAAIVIAFVERLAERDELDLEACGEFLVLISALLELKARALFPDEEAELAELEPEEAAEELARRLAEYRRMKEAAGWLAERLAAERDRFFRARAGAACAGARAHARAAGSRSSSRAALRLLAEPPPQVSLAHMPLRFPPVSQFLERFRALLRRRRRFDLDAEIGDAAARRPGRRVPRAARAAQGGRDRARAGRAVRADKGFPSRRRKEERMDRPLRLITANPVDQLARTLEALLVVASAPLSVDELAQAADDDHGADRDSRSGCSPTATARGAAGSCSSTLPAATPSARHARPRRLASGSSSGRSSAGSRRRHSRRSSIVAYLGPCSRPEIARIRGVAADSAVAGLLERGLIAEAGRDDGPGGAVRYRTTPLFERVFGLESLAALPRLDDLGDTAAEIRERLHSVAVGKTA